MASSVPITFRLGRRVLFSIDRPGLWLHRPPNQLPFPPGENGPRWDALEQQVDVALSLEAVTADLARIKMVNGSLRYVRSYENRYLVRLDGSFDHYLGRFSKKSRYNLQRSLRKFFESNDGVAGCREYSAPEEMGEFYSRATDISFRSWRRRGGATLDQRWSLPELQAEAELGLIRGYILEQGRQGIAFVLCRAEGKNIRYAQIGYDEQYEKWSPGTVCFLIILRKFFEEQKFDWLDFGETHLAYKSFFSTDCIRTAKVYYFRPRPLNFILAYCLNVFERITDMIAALLDRFAIKGKVKDLIGGWSVGKRSDAEKVFGRSSGSDRAPRAEQELKHAIVREEA